MRLRLSRDVERPLRAHVDELAMRGTGLLFVLSLAALFWWWQINPLLEAWLSSLPLGAAEGTVSIYDPHGWMSTRWSMIALLALITTLPLASHQLLSFADEGLLPSERKWLRMVTIGGVTLGLLSAIMWWLWGYPLAIESAGTISAVDGIGTQYDAVLLFEVGIGISWWIFLIIISLIGLTMARLLSLMVTEPFDPFRIRVHGTLLFLWWLTCPSALEGVWLPFSILLVILPEMVIQWMPKPVLSSKARAPLPVFDSEGGLHHRLFAMCHCEGACPSVSASMSPQSLGWVENSALCLDPDARDALLDAVVRHRVSNLIISGCDGTPLPMEFRQSIASSNCQLSGLGWLDTNTTPSHRKSALSDLAISSED
ncbi:MAG: twin-arginine translocase subunit TatC [Candidatus Poseidoniales archaeon]|nr:twin-arginine translocase subunit TatC [Candidatus Poseidoniales archaeon]